MKTSKYYYFNNWCLFHYIEINNESLNVTLYGPGNTNLTSKTRSTAMRKAFSFPRICFTKRTGGDFRWIKIIGAGVCVSVPDRPLILIKSEITDTILLVTGHYNDIMMNSYSFQKKYRRHGLHFVQRAGHREAFFHLRWFRTDARVVC